jgi:hypothetical protein
LLLIELIDPIVDVTPLPQQPLKPFEKCLHPSDLRANPMAFGAWSRQPWLIALGLPVIILAWFAGDEE